MHIHPISICSRKSRGVSLCMMEVGSGYDGWLWMAQTWSTKIRASKWCVADGVWKVDEGSVSHAIDPRCADCSLDDSRTWDSRDLMSWGVCIVIYSIPFA